MRVSNFMTNTPLRTLHLKTSNVRLDLCSLWRSFLTGMVAAASEGQRWENTLQATPRSLITSCLIKIDLTCKGLKLVALKIYYLILFFPLTSRKILLFESYYVLGLGNTLSSQLCESLSFY